MAERTKEVKERKSKKDKDGKKKEKRSDKDGVHKSKKDKKVKTATNGDAATALSETPAVEKPDAKEEAEAEDHVDVVMRDEPPIGALVPFANPLADDKVQKKVLKSVRKGMDFCACSRAAIGVPLTAAPHRLIQQPIIDLFLFTAAKNRCVKRGVKEVVKALRKSPVLPPGSSPWGVVVLAADISPMDVISHIPVLCEDHNIPYIYVTSRAELGAAGSTKRPTSVVLVCPEHGSKRKAAQQQQQQQQKEGEKTKDGDVEDFADVYKSLVKVVEKEMRNVRI